ncbi:hypothetical protein DYQ91_02085 [Xanthomonas sp. LMG 8989]|nr:hypothetical protein [Xanthomonas sp. LMG 8989]
MRRRREATRRVLAHEAAPVASSALRGTFPKTRTMLPSGKETATAACALNPEHAAPRLRVPLARRRGKWTSVHARAMTQPWGAQLRGTSVGLGSRAAGAQNQ